MHIANSSATLPSTSLPSTSLRAGRASRAVTVAVLLLGLIPLVTLALVLSEERSEAERALRTALDEASAEYQRTRGLPSLRRLYEVQLKEERLRVPELMREKRTLRLKVAELRNSIAATERRFGFTTMHGAAAESTGGKSIAAALQYLHSTVPVLGNAPGGLSFLRRVLVAPLGGVLEEDLKWGMLRSILTAIATVDQKRDELVALEEQRGQITQETLHSVERLEGAERGLKVTEEQLKNIRETVEEVHSQVLRMQSALARIDAKIKSRIERELLEKGLLTPGAIDRARIPVAPQFAWPAYGPQSAGFLDASYQERFGIPHEGLDIVIGQGSPIFSAADGIVFLARDGGARGYSYVLVGHRGGYATLYGHLSKITVTSGQDLRQGDAVGLSGGEIGAPGSGPTTTGPHLHFEVIRDGMSIDPASVLP